MQPDPFRDQPVVKGDRVRLEPQGLEHFDGLWQMLNDEEGARMTGSRHRFEEEFARTWVATRQDHDDRADFAVVRNDDGEVLGEVVLNELDATNACCNFRIGLRGPEVFGKGYGTEATGLLLDYAFDLVGLHRVELEVYEFNPRGRRCYEKAGFVQEGVRRKALHWEGEWYDVVLMGILASDPRPSVAR
jgi:RimJ/RimL family protein N-acetyltransferase